jgi:hypothetical protein
MVGNAPASVGLKLPKNQLPYEGPKLEELWGKAGADKTAYYYPGTSQMSPGQLAVLLGVAGSPAIAGGVSGARKGHQYSPEESKGLGATLGGLGGAAVGLPAGIGGIALLEALTGNKGKYLKLPTYVAGGALGGGLAGYGIGKALTRNADKVENTRNARATRVDTAAMEEEKQASLVPFEEHKTAFYLSGAEYALEKLGFIGGLAAKLAPMGQKAMGWAAKNPTVASSLGTSAVGAGVGAATAGEGNRLQGAALGAAGGAALGAGAAKAYQHSPMVRGAVKRVGNFMADPTTNSILQDAAIASA